MNDDLDPLIHAPKRLRIMTMLHAVESAEFAFVQERLDVSASDLSKQMSAFADAGYVKAHKTGRGVHALMLPLAPLDAQRHLGLSFVT